MSKSIDPLHSQNHIYRILDDLQRFKLEDDEVKWSTVNFEVLLLAICWHDTWKSFKFPHSKKAMLYHNFVDGLGSMRLFSKRVKRLNLEKKIINKAKYAIRKHSSFQILPKRTLESKILRYLDQLEEWSVDRVKEALGSSPKFQELLAKLYNLAKYYFEHKMLTSTDKKYYFAWSKSQFRDRKNQFISQLLHPSSPTRIETNYLKSEVLS